MTRVVSLTLILVLALVAAPAQAQTQETRSISVEGTASRQIPNDTARFTATVSAQRRTARRALAAASQRTRRALAALSELGVARRDTRTSGASVGPVYERDRRTRRLRLVGYRARSGVRVTVRDLSRVGRAIDALVEAGARGIGSFTFFAADTDSVYRDVLGKAFDDARAKAELLAARAGLTLGSARSIIEGADEFFGGGGGGGFEVQADAPRARVPVRPGRTTVEATVSVLFDATAP